jgi:hypothetical protein
MKLCRTLLLVGSILTVLIPAQAQEMEINPFGGAIFSSSVAESADFKDVAVYGIRWSVFAIPQFSYEVTFGHQNHFEFEDTDPNSRAYIWEFSGVYHPGREVPGGRPRRFAPFLTAGLGFLSADVKDSGYYFALTGDTAHGFETPPVLSVPNSRTVHLSSGDMFFTFNYGGGVKASRLLGPLGIRFDVRGRTAPNLFGSSATFIETSGGITFNWEFPY